MPLRPWTRDREGVLPTKLEDWVAADHPVRFVAAFVEGLTDAEWAALEIVPGGHPGGAPAYDPAVLLAVWFYGFMSGVRSCRKLAVACAEQVPFLWLSGGQRPDHNTLWRFYQRHRGGMHVLFKRTVATAATSGLVVWAIQAVDGTKIGGNAAKDRTLDAAALAKLLERVEAAIADLEAQNRPDGPPTPPRLPAELAQAERLRVRVRAALDQVTAPDGPTRLNLTDPEAGLVKGRHGVVAGYNAQAAVARVDLPGTRPARLLTAVAVVPDADDHGQLLPMLARVDATTGRGSPRCWPTVATTMGRRWRSVPRGGNGSSCPRPSSPRWLIPSIRSTLPTTRPPMPSPARPGTRSPSGASRRGPLAR